MLSAADPYGTGVLVPEVHGRLVKDLDAFARDAAILPKWIYTPLAEQVTLSEVKWVRNFRRHKTDGVFGLCLTGKAEDLDVDSHMAAIAGALVRP